MHLLFDLAYFIIYIIDYNGGSNTLYTFIFVFWQTLETIVDEFDLGSILGGSDILVGSYPINEDGIESFYWERRYTLNSEVITKTILMNVRITPDSVRVESCYIDMSINSLGGIQQSYSNHSLWSWVGLMLWRIWGYIYTFILKLNELRDAHFFKNYKFDDDQSTIVSVTVFVIMILLRLIYEIYEESKSKGFINWKWDLAKLLFISFIIVLLCSIVMKL